jgi:hypothetical protein
MRNARNRQRRSARPSSFRESKPIILIVCEGEKTETEYFLGFAEAACNPAVKVRIADEHGVPKTLVKIAKEYKKDAEEKSGRVGDSSFVYDSIWCVFDVDEHPRLGEAIEMARDNSIELAISNPCIELWLLLHFRENPGMQNRNKMRELLEGYVPGYDKHVDYAAYAAGYQQAVRRASRMDQAAEEAGDAGRNPTTGVYRLTELIRS